MTRKQPYGRASDVATTAKAPRSESRAYRHGVRSGTEEGRDFDNLGDTAEGLRQILEESFRTVEVDVVGSTANFTATGPRPS